MTKLLLIDDTPEILELLTFSLRDHGYDVAPSGFTPDVIELLGEQKAEALVLDCTSYEMSEALFDAVRGHGAFGALPIVIISDTPEKADASPSAMSAPPETFRWARRRRKLPRIRSATVPAITA